MNHLSHRSFVLAFTLLYGILSMNPVLGQSAPPEKSQVNMSDVTLWRNHTVTLSHDGNWHVVQYRKSSRDEFEHQDKSENEADSEDQEQAEQIKLYGEGSLSDVLYLRNADGSKTFEIENGTRPKFSQDSQWIAYAIESADKPDSQEEKSSKEPATIELRSLENDTQKNWKLKSENASGSFWFSEDTNHFIILSKSGLLLFDLENQTEHYIGHVGEYYLSKKSNRLYYTIKTDDRNGNGIYVFDLESQSTKTLISNTDTFSSLRFPTDDVALAAFQVKPKAETDDEDSQSDPKVQLVVIQSLNQESPTPTVFDPIEFEEVPENASLLARGLEWSQDGKRLFVKFEMNEPSDKDEAETKEADDSSSGDNLPTADSDTNNIDPAEPTPEITPQGNVDVWHWKDETLQSQQMIAGDSSNEQVDDFVIDLEQKKWIRLTEDDLRISEKSRDGRWAIVTNNKPYVSDWDVRRADIYRLNLLTGEKELILKRHSGGLQIHPNGSVAVYWHERHYWAYSFAENTHRKITDSTPVSFVNTDYDYHGAEPAFGIEGFADSGQSVILRHRHDLWIQPLDGTPARCLTGGKGEAEKIRFRLAIPPNSRDDDLEIEELYTDLSGPILLRGIGSQSKESGFFRLNQGEVQSLIYEASDISQLQKADDAEIATFKKGNYQDYPETFLSDLSFASPQQLTHTNRHQQQFRWGRRVLIEYTNNDGRPLQGILSIPEGYAEGDRLPMIVYSYEKLSNGLHRYSTPGVPGAGVSEMMYVSDDYLYLQPDIHFRKRTSHSDMHECIDAAIRRVVELGYADEKRIGYIGHSYGGHAAMYISTQENRFAAIAGGAGVSNLIQGFNVDIVRDGSNEQDYYISGQGRLTRSPADDLSLYIDQSPVFHAKNMDTPLLLYHGTADNVVLWEHSFGFYNLLRFLKKPVILLSYRGEGHGIRDFENRKDLQLRLKDFFDHHLKGKDAPPWIEEGVPFENRPEDTREDSERTLPPWK